MTATPRLSRPISATRLRTLTADSRDHPRGQAHLSAASGLVCAHGRVYVIADDEHHLGVFHDQEAPARLHRIFPGDLPDDKRARKRVKPDLETLFRWPNFRMGGCDALVAFGSGSRPNRSVGVVIPLNSRGEPTEEVVRFDMTPFHGPLRSALGEINIEGAFVAGSDLMLLNRGTRGGSGNAAIRYPLQCLRRVIQGDTTPAMPASIQTHVLGSIDGVPLGFTDGACLPDGGWVFSAVAEDTRSSYADGECLGSVIGVVSAAGELRALHPLVQRVKVEGIDVHVTPDRTNLCMVTDTDDPAHASELLLARL